MRKEVIINLLIFLIIIAGLGAIRYLTDKVKNIPQLADLPKTNFSVPPPKFTTPKVPTPIINSIYKVQFTGNPNTDIPAVFTDPNYRQIVESINSSQNQSDDATKYQNYKNAFNLTSKAYKETKNPDFFLSLLAIRSAARSLDNFQASDMPLPK